MKTKTKSPFTTLLDVETQQMLEALASHQGCNKAQVVRAAIRYHFGLMRATGSPVAGGQDMTLAGLKAPEIKEDTNAPAE